VDADEVHDRTAHSHYLDYQTKENETDGTCGQCGGDEKCTQCFWRGRGEGNKSLGILRLNGFRRIFKKQCTAPPKDTEFLSVLFG